MGKFSTVLTLGESSFKLWEIITLYLFAIFKLSCYLSVSICTKKADGHVYLVRPLFSFVLRVTYANQPHKSDIYYTNTFLQIIIEKFDVLTLKLIVDTGVSFFQKKKKKNPTVL